MQSIYIMSTADLIAAREVNHSLSIWIAVESGDLGVN
jgi:hypothetical protein